MHREICSCITWLPGMMGWVSLKCTPIWPAGRDEGPGTRRMHTKGPYAVPYTCGGIPQHSTLQHQGPESRCLVRWASLTNMFGQNAVMLRPSIPMRAAQGVVGCMLLMQQTWMQPLGIIARTPRENSLAFLCRESLQSQCWKKLASLLPLEKFCYG